MKYDVNPALVDGVRMKRSRFVMRGGCDIIGYVDGKFFGIEVKRPGGVVSAIQNAFHSRLKRDGVICGVAMSVEEALRIIGRRV